uniref:Uncharacterized protein n=1 Tax=Compsopogon caeruleus TaxID=31354 RepID=A0A7S1TAM6_9RHOD
MLLQVLGRESSLVCSIWLKLNCGVKRLQAHFVSSTPRFASSNGMKFNEATRLRSRIVLNQIVDLEGRRVNYHGKQCLSADRFPTEEYIHDAGLASTSPLVL